MKLFIWENVYRVQWGVAHLFVAAETLEEAKQIARTGPAWTERYNTPRGIKLGEPTKVLDGPACAWTHVEE